MPRNQQGLWNTDFSPLTWPVKTHSANSAIRYLCVCVCVRACVRACVRVCVCVRARAHNFHLGIFFSTRQLSLTPFPISETTFQASNQNIFELEFLQLLEDGIVCVLILMVRFWDVHDDAGGILLNCLNSADDIIIGKTIEKNNRQWLRQTLLFVSCQREDNSSSLQSVPPPPPPPPQKKKKKKKKKKKA